MLPIRVPSLAERKEDIGALADRFCEIACGRHGLPRLTLSHNARRAAEAAAWPGNVRQLSHAIEAAVIRAAGADATEIGVRHLFPEAQEPPASAGRPTFQEATRRFQRELIQAALERNQWNVTDTARELDMARSHLYGLIRGLEIVRSDR